VTSLAARTITLVSAKGFVAREYHSFACTGSLKKKKFRVFVNTTF
jgi:hypothetical protein